MFKLAKPVFFICETPLHAGSGSELGIVDLPIQRERHTDFPKIEGSSLKGGIREAFEELLERQKNGHGVLRETPSKIRLLNKFLTIAAKCPGKKEGEEQKKIQLEEAIELAFGPENAGNDAHAGALGFTDARLLLFPVKSMKGVFAWITCPKALQQFQNDLKLSDINLGFELPGEKTAPNGCQLFVQGNKIVLEEYTFEITAEHTNRENCSKLANWLSNNLFPQQEPVYDYWREKILTDVVVLSNDDFRDFVMLSTEVITRIKINNDTGTVQQGALFTEEYLPAESMLYSLALASPIFHDNKGIFKQNGMSEETVVMEFFRNGLPDVIQLGGNATIGKGIVRTHLMEA